MTARTSAPGSAWLVERKPRPHAATHLYCFPHAGGSAGEYARWSDGLPQVAVRAIAVPGRGARLDEPSIHRMADLVDAIVDAVPFEEPYALFGHSLGGLVAFEVARALRDLGREPWHLYVSSVGAPPITHGTRSLHELPDDEFLAEIERRWGALPPQVHAHPQVRAMVLDQQRSDIEIFETYRYASGRPLTCPITAVQGDREPFDLAAWSAHTTGPCATHRLPGGHFYLRDQRDALLALIASEES